jgi:hypothetical protein
MCGEEIVGKLDKGPRNFAKQYDVALALEKLKEKLIGKKDGITPTGLNNNELLKLLNSKDMPITFFCFKRQDREFT